MQAAANDIDQAEMMDLSQSPNKHSDDSSERKAAAAAALQAQGSTTPMLGLAMGGAMSGSADPYWQRLSDLIVQGGIAAVHADELRQVFAVEHQDRWRGHVPAYLLSGRVVPLLYEHHPAGQAQHESISRCSLQCA